MIVQAPSKDLWRKMTSAGFQFSPGVFTVKDADPEETLERFVCEGDADGIRSKQEGGS